MSDKIEKLNKFVNDVVKHLVKFDLKPAGIKDYHGGVWAWFETPELKLFIGTIPQIKTAHYDFTFCLPAEGPLLPFLMMLLHAKMRDDYGFKQDSSNTIKRTIDEDKENPKEIAFMLINFIENYKSLRQEVVHFANKSVFEFGDFIKGLKTDTDIATAFKK